MFGQPRRRSIAHRYATLLCGATLALLLTSGALEMYFGFGEAREHIASLQASQAERAAQEIESYLSRIDKGLTDLARMPWGEAGFDDAMRRDEFYRLMHQVPAITDLQVIDARGRERLYVSKREDDRFESLRPFEDASLLGQGGASPRYGRTFFPDGMSPAVRVAVGQGDDMIVATVDLRLLDEIIEHLRVGGRGLAYIVDASDRLVAHASPTEVLRQPDLSHFDAVQRMRSAASNRGPWSATIDTVDLQGRPVIASAARVAAPGWLLVIEQPRAEAMGPVIATLERTIALIVVGGILAVGAGVLFGRQMAAPIVALRRATGRISGGDLASSIEIRSGDEIEDLASDFNQMAADLRESYAGLEAKVAERTTQLSEARDRLQARAVEIDELNARLMSQLIELEARRDEAERASVAKTRFLATASHDLRQPMHSISLLVSVLKDRLDGPESLLLAEKIQSSVATMEELFVSLLDISKLDIGAVTPAVEDVDLGRLFTRIEQTWGPQAAEKGLALRVRPTRLLARSDAALLQRIVGNLVSNAIRYTSAGRIVVAARRRGEQCVVQVIDTGRGIAEEHLEAIFEEFYRINPSDGSAGRGLGLGLSIVQRGSQLLGHGLRVRSRPGRGSMFELEMPCGQGGLRDVDPPADNAQDAKEIAGAFIVLVEDDMDNRSALRDRLLGWRCHVLAAASMDEALVQSREHLRAPDLIITDFELGAGGNGFEVIRRMREFYEEDIAALMLTANTDVDLRCSAQQLRAVLLHKPVGNDRLLPAALQAMRSMDKA